MGHLNLDWTQVLSIKLSSSFLMVGLVAAVLLLSYLINIVLVKSIGGIYRVFIAPGIILHEMSHAFGCIITGAKINSIAVFKKDGGEVRHTAPKIPILGQIIISLAPFAAGAVLIYVLSKAVGIKPIEISEMRALVANPLGQMWRIVSSIDFLALRTWLALYLIVSIAVTMTPSFQDLRNVAASMAVVVAAYLVLVKYLGADLSLEIFRRPELYMVMVSCVAILIVVFLLSIVIAVVGDLFFKKQ